jgi:predicted nucleic acid-binding protein
VIAFLDASAVIYAVEGTQALAEALKQQLRQLAGSEQASAGGLQLAISRLSWLECHVGPLRRRDAVALARFDAFFLHPDLMWVELTESLVQQATLLRAEHNLRTPDALQAASCLQLGPDAVMVTGDAAFQRVQALRLALVNGAEGGA